MKVYGGGWGADGAWNSERAGRDRRIGGNKPELKGKIHFFNPNCDNMSKRNDFAELFLFFILECSQARIFVL